MQKFVLAYILTGLTMTNCSRELPEKKVPSLVQNAFKAQFVDAKDIDWKKNGQLYVVEFESGTMEEDHKVMFDTLGTIVMHKYEVAAESLPASIVTVIQSKYKDYKIDEVENLVKDGITYYQLELEKGLKKEHLVLTGSGTLSNQINYWD